MSDRAPHIDGLRTIAVALVIVFHAYPKILTGGFIGVDVFFVISGFLITGIIRRGCERGQFSFLRFYENRARRITPALALVLACSIAAGYWLLLPSSYYELAKEAIAATFFVPNILFWSQVGYFDKAADLKPLLHLWSLGVEEQFYLFWPLILFATARNKLLQISVLACITVASLVYCWLLTPIDQSSAFFLPMTRIWELSTGALLTFVPQAGSSSIKRNAAAAVGLIAIIGAAIALTPGSVFPGIVAAVPVLGSALVIWSRSTALSIAPLPYIGRISYPLYLWHWPVLFFFRNAEIEQPLTAIAISILLAIFTYHVVEPPFRRDRNGNARISAKWTFAASAAVALMSTPVWASSGWYSRYPADVASTLATANYDYGKDSRLYTCWLVDEKGPQQFAQECTLSTQSPSVLVWGDSHAARLYPGLHSEFKELSVWQLTRASCPPMNDPLRSERCRTSYSEILERISKNRPQTVVLFSACENYYGKWLPDSEHLAILRSTIKDLVDAKIEDIVLVGPAPRWKPDAPTVAYNAWLKTGTIPERATTDTSSTRLIDTQMKVLATETGARYYSILDNLCNAEGCRLRLPDEPGTLLSWDYGHLTTAGSKIVARSLRQSGAIATTN